MYIIHSNTRALGKRNLIWYDKLNPISNVDSNWLFVSRVLSTNPFIPKNNIIGEKQITIGKFTMKALV